MFHLCPPIGSEVLGKREGGGAYLAPLSQARAAGGWRESVESPLWRRPSAAALGDEGGGVGGSWHTWVLT